MTSGELIAARVLVNAATPGPWESTTEDHMPIGLHVRGRSLLMLDRDGMACVDRREDAAFIAASRLLVPALLNEIARLTLERDEARMRDLNLVNQASPQRGGK